MSRQAGSRQAGSCQRSLAAAAAQRPGPWSSSSDRAAKNDRLCLPPPPACRSLPLSSLPAAAPVHDSAAARICLDFPPGREQPSQPPSLFRPRLAAFSEIPKDCVCIGCCRSRVEKAAKRLALHGHVRVVRQAEDSAAHGRRERKSERRIRKVEITPEGDRGARKKSTER